MECLSIYHRKCLTCKHFVDGAKTNNVKCHHSNGNRDCPASELKIVVTGRLKTLAKQLVQARNDLDYQAEAKVLAEVGSESMEVRKTFNLLVQQVIDRG